LNRRGSNTGVTQDPHSRNKSVELEPASLQEVGERELARLETASVGLPVLAGGVANDGVLGWPRQQHPGLLERLTHGGAHERPRERLVRVEQVRPLAGG